MATATVNERLARPRRLIDNDDVVCEAGVAARSGNAVLCRVTDTLIDARQDPSSLQTFCLGCPSDCPVWRAEKDAIAARRRGALDARR